MLKFLSPFSTLYLLCLRPPIHRHHHSGLHRLPPSPQIRSPAPPPLHKSRFPVGPPLYLIIHHFSRQSAPSLGVLLIYQFLSETRISFEILAIQIGIYHQTRI